jgi:hypothetical protein
MTSLLNFIKICQLLQKLVVGNPDRQHGDLIRFTFLGEESRQKLDLKEVRYNVHSLFNNTFSSSDYIMWDGKMVRE